MTITLHAVNELIATLECAGELSIREQKFLKLAKEFRICSASLDAAIKTGNMLADQNAQLAAENVGLKAAINAVNRTAEECEVNGDELKYVVEPSEFEALIDFLDETPSTDRFYAGIKAHGLPANIAEIIDSGDLETICYESERSYAEDFRLALYNFRQLREGAK
ncbi:TPA: hypothetical protein R2K55_005167 [Raoultella ornithinolytica]|nr:MULTISPECIES: hypothetical protein [Klebsiella/Raoultella group]WLP44725.1 hypothetical protein Q7A27_18925 [Raoultella ornithinolytica]HEC2553466.1 hypothetical protein [Raoultella ornithinolytica]HEC2606162.1 hypothetical protein [Raoultella ornithinolytica]